MDEFELTLNFKGRDILLPVRFLQYANSYKLEMQLAGITVLFEPDEERNWRALISYEDLQANRKLDKNLLELICSELNTLLK